MNTSIENFMKAKAGLFTLLILLVGFAGIGQTTTDPAQNSTAELVSHGDDINVAAISETASVNVVTAQEVSEEINWDAFRAKVKVAAKEAALETNAELEQDLNEIYRESYDMVREQLLLLSAEPVKLTKEDLKVGWHNLTNRHFTPTNSKDPGGVLSLFYS